MKVTLSLMEMNGVAAVQTSLLDLTVKQVMMVLRKEIRKV